MSTVVPKFVLFDLDGVLVDTREIWFRLVEEAGRRFRGRPVTRDEFEPTFGQGTEADRRGFNLNCTTEELNRYYAEHFHEHASGLWINPDARPVIEALRRRGKKLGVVTNTVSTLAMQVLQNAHLLDCFSAVASADQVKHAKPAPDVICRALDLLGAPANEAWVIGDSRYDREAAKAAGTFFVGLGTEGDLRIDRLQDLEKF